MVSSFVQVNSIIQMHQERTDSIPESVSIQRRWVRLTINWPVWDAVSAWRKFLAKSSIVWCYVWKCVWIDWIEMLKLIKDIHTPSVDHPMLLIFNSLDVKLTMIKLSLQMLRQAVKFIYYDLVYGLVRVKDQSEGGAGGGGAEDPRAAISQLRQRVTEYLRSCEALLMQSPHKKVGSVWCSFPARTVLLLSIFLGVAWSV